MSHPRMQIYINGETYGDVSRSSKTVQNPADSSSVVGEFYLGNAEDAEKAVNAAQSALAEWAGKPAVERGAYLLRVASLLRQRKESLARRLTLENGKPINESRAEVEGAAAHFEWYAEEARRACGRLMPPATSSKRHLVIQQPIGVVGIITPWNFPLVLWARKLAPALAAGCTTVTRPATQTTTVTLEGTRCCHEAGIPPGVVNLVTGPAREVSNHLLRNPSCRKLSFTGSTEVGRELIKGSAAQIKKLSLELGGHAPAIVFADADLEVALEGVLWSKFRNNGQSCIATNRIYVEEEILGDFVQGFQRKVEELKVANGLEEDAQLGAVVDSVGMDKLALHVKDALDKGATLVAGGKHLEGSQYEKGHFFAPTILTDVTDEMLCMSQETFGPVAPITSFRREEEVIRRANNTIYGLVAYVFTSNLRRAFAVGEALEAGTIGINDPVPSTTIAPFGGFKQSGIGRECGSEGLDAFMETKHISVLL